VSVWTKYNRGSRSISIIQILEHRVFDKSAPAREQIKLARVQYAYIEEAKTPQIILSYPKMVMHKVCALSDIY
jgi:hypothetical protein